MQNSLPCQFPDLPAAPTVKHAVTHIVYSQALSFETEGLVSENSELISTGAPTVKGTILWEIELR